MPNFNVDFNGLSPEWGTINIPDATNADEAESLAREQILHTYPEYEEVTIGDVREIKA